jgi:hypothetical protein
VRLAAGAVRRKARAGDHRPTWQRRGRDKPAITDFSGFRGGDRLFATSGTTLLGSTGHGRTFDEKADQAISR